MAISAATTASNRIVRGGPGRSVFEKAKPFLTSNSTFKQGDLLYLDTSTHEIKRVGATGDAATLLGIADQSVTEGKPVGPYDGLTDVDAAQAVDDMTGPKFGVNVKLKLKASDAFNPGNKVYLADGQDSQTVSVTDPGDHNYIGIFDDAAVASAASGQEAEIFLLATYPTVLA